MSSCVPAPSKVTVLLPGVKVPLVFVQLPVTSNVPDVAVNVPLPKLTLPTVILALCPLNVPPLTVKLSKLWVPLEAKYVTPVGIVKVVLLIVTSCVLLSNVPAPVKVKLLLTVKACPVNCRVVVLVSVKL